MTDVTPPAGDLPPPPPGPPGPEFWQETPAGPSAPAPQRPPTFLVAPEVQVPTMTAAGTLPPELAGFWRRAWARVVTGLLWLVVLQVGANAIAALFRFLLSAAPNEAFAWIGLGVTTAYGLLVSYLIWSRPLSSSGGTVGMRQMGLRIRSASRHPALTREQAFKRSLLAFLPLVFASGSGWFLLFEPSDDAIVVCVIIEAALTLLVVLGALWSLANPRRQTVWDIVGDTVVLAEREPSWLAVCAFVAGVLGPAGGFVVTVFLIGSERMQSDFENLSETESAGKWFLANVPTLALSAVAIVLGHLAVRDTRWEGRHRAGRGLARTGLVLGYLVPVAIVVTVLFGLIYRRIDDRLTQSCEETRADIVTAAESYRTLNGTYPDSINALAVGIYLDDPDLGESWTLTSDGASYRLAGKENCKKA